MTDPKCFDLRGVWWEMSALTLHNYNSALKAGMWVLSHFGQASEGGAFLAMPGSIPQGLFFLRLNNHNIMFIPKDVHKQKC